MEAMARECEEELGFMPEYTRLVPIEKFTTYDSKFVYHTFFANVEEEFIPKLNSEHYGYAWVASGHYPKPMHPGLWSTVNFDAVQEKIAAIEQLVKNDQ
jgi:8-oxo-dGTP pyrophosphatase MutT (NUDIX family)